MKDGPFTPAGAMAAVGGNAMVSKQTNLNYPAQRNILSCIYEGMQVPIDAALRDREPLLHQDRDHAASQGHDPHTVREHAGARQRRQSPRRLPDLRDQEGRRASAPA